MCCVLFRIRQSSQSGAAGWKERDRDYTFLRSDTPAESINKNPGQQQREEQQQQPPKRIRRYAKLGEKNKERPGASGIRHTEREKKESSPPQSLYVMYVCTES